MKPINFVATLAAEIEKAAATPPTRAIVSALNLGLATLAFWLTLVGDLPPIVLGLGFVGALFTIALIAMAETSTRGLRRWGRYGLAVLTAVCSLYFLLQGSRFAEWILGIDVFTRLDLVAGGVLIAVTFLLMKHYVGPGLTLVVAILFGYLLGGHLLPGILYHRPFPIAEVIEQSIISSNGGIFGTPVLAAVRYVYLFIIFGMLLEVAGGGHFFFNLAAMVTGRQAGGVAKMSVISSGMFGMISGSPTADILTTGSINIPMMKKAGYPPRLAGAIETVASVGGSLVPPVMGSVVFLLVEFTGIQYFSVIQASIALAALYYLGILWQVHHQSIRHQYGKLPEEHIASFVQVMRGGWPYVLSISLLVILIAQGYTPTYSVTLAMAALILSSWISPQPEYRLSPAKILRVVIRAGLMLAPLVAAVAGAGLVEEALNVTGLASKLSFLLVDISAGRSFFVLLAAAAVTILFGMGMPVTAVYTLAAVLLSPALLQAGFGLLPAHLFLVWFSVAAHVTPPIAVAAYVASTIARSPPMAVAVSACRMAFPVYVLPFAFVYRPGLLLDGSWMQIVIDITTALIGVYLLAAASVGFHGAQLKWPMRIAIGAAGIMATLLPWLPGCILASALGTGILAGHHYTSLRRVELSS